MYYTKVTLYCMVKDIQNRLEINGNIVEHIRVCANNIELF